MAAGLGAEVEYVKFEWNEAASDIERIRNAAKAFQPTIITVVHCETPSGIVNPIDKIGVVAKEVGALYYVDFVSSGGGVEVRVDVRYFSSIFTRHTLAVGYFRENYDTDGSCLCIIGDN
jgi:aspartate aminotransferase-like enzyme